MLWSDGANGGTYYGGTRPLCSDHHVVAAIRGVMVEMVVMVVTMEMSLWPLWKCHGH